MSMRKSYSHNNAVCEKYTKNIRSIVGKAFLFLCIFHKDLQIVKIVLAIYKVLSVLSFPRKYNIVISRNSEKIKRKREEQS